jgi:hypothetical protein
MARRVPPDETQGMLVFDFEDDTREYAPPGLPLRVALMRAARALRRGMPAPRLSLRLCWPIALPPRGEHARRVYVD